MTSQEQLSRISDDLRAVQARLHRLAAHTPEERWNHRRDRRRWSVAECVAHLNLTSRVFLPLIEAALADARRLGASSGATYRHGAVGALLARMVGPMMQLGSVQIGRIKTTPPFVPQGDLPPATLIEDFDRDHAALIQRVADSDGLPIDRVALVSPFNARVRYSLYTAFVIIPRHDERHVIQAERVWPSSELSAWDRAGI